MKAYPEFQNNTAVDVIQNDKRKVPRVEERATLDNLVRTRLFINWQLSAELTTKETPFYFHTSMKYKKRAPKMPNKKNTTPTKQAINQILNP